MKIIFLLLLFLIPQDQYPLKSGKPTTRGINYYIDVNKLRIKSDVEKVIQDSIFLDVEIKTDDIRTYSGYDSLDLGYHIAYKNGSDEIIIHNQPVYDAYDIESLTKFKKSYLTFNGNFVKTVLIHELGHTYFLQIVLETKFNNLEAYPEYDITNSIRYYPNLQGAFGAIFVEEGVCQYIVGKMNQMIKIKPFIPITIDDIIKKENLRNLRYNYSEYYLKNFLDSLGLKQGIIILVRNKPPTYDEILNPHLYFNRLKP